MSSHPEAKKVNVAVVGLGLMGITHLRAYQKIAGARIVAVCSPNTTPQNGKIRGMAGNIVNSEDLLLGPEVKAYRKLEDLLANPEVQLVDICTPTSLHFEQAVASLRASKHVICEKPLTRTSVSARELVRIGKKSERFLMPAMCMRFWPGWSWLKDVLTDQRYGSMLAARFYRVSPKPFWGSQSTYKSGAETGGALFDLHIHDTDFVYFLFGKPEGVYSSGVIGGDGSIDHVVTQYLYPSGPAVHAEGSWLSSASFNMGFSIHCENATLEFDLARGAEAVRVSVKGQAPFFINCGATDGYLEELRYMVACVEKNTPPAVATGEDAITVLEMCEAEERSIKSRQVQHLL